MLLALDVGNTNVTIGVFKRKEIIEVFRITTKLPRTSDEFGILISNLLKEKGLDEHEVKAAIIGSVVPNIMHSLTSGLIKYFDVKPINLARSQTASRTLVPTRTFSRLSAFSKRSGITSAGFLFARCLASVPYTQRPFTYPSIRGI